MFRKAETRLGEGGLANFPARVGSNRGDYFQGCRVFVWLGREAASATLWLCWRMVGAKLLAKAAASLFYVAPALVASKTKRQC